MKKSLYLAVLLAVILFVPQNVVSQFKSSYFKAIEKEKYDDTEKKLLKNLIKKPADVEMNFTMAILYITPKFTNYNEEKAYEYLVKAQKAYENADDKTKKKLDKIPINQIILENYTDTICSSAFKKVSDINTVEAYDNFLSVYESAPAKYLNEATELRNEKKFEEVVESNSIENFQDFINRFPDAKQREKAITKRNELAFKKTQRLDKIQDYRDFIKKYPDAVQVNDAYEKIHELAYQQAERENTAASYKYFIDEYPSSKQYKKAVSMMEKRQFVENTTPGDWKKYRDFVSRFPENSWKNFALDSIYMIGAKTENIEILNYCVETFSGDNKKLALHKLYNIFTSDGEKSSLDMFYSIYDDPIFNDYKMVDYKYAEIGDSLLKLIPQEMNKPLFDKYIKEIAPGEKAYRVLRRLIEFDITTKNWSKALETVNGYAQYFKGKNKSLTDLQFFLEKLKNAPKPKVTEPVEIPAATETKPETVVTEEKTSESVPVENTTNDDANSSTATPDNQAEPSSPQNEN